MHYFLCCCVPHVVYLFIPIRFFTKVDVIIDSMKSQKGHCQISVRYLFQSKNFLSKGLLLVSVFCYLKEYLSCSISGWVTWQEIWRKIQASCRNCFQINNWRGFISWYPGWGYNWSCFGSISSFIALWAWFQLPHIRLVIPKSISVGNFPEGLSCHSFTCFLLGLIYSTPL